MEETVGEIGPQGQFPPLSPFITPSTEYELFVALRWRYTWKASSWIDRACDRWN
jgi:hypothetical protein